MKVSYNEITTLCQKAFEGMGFSVGDYEDAGEMVAWLALHGFDSLSLLEEGLSQKLIEPNQSPSLTWDDGFAMLFDLHGASTLLMGPLSLELSYTKARETGIVAVRLRNCQQPTFLLNYLVRCAKRGINIFAQWSEDASISITHTIIVAKNSNYPTIYTHLKTVPPTKWVDEPTITIYFSKEASQLPDFSPQETDTVQDLAWFQQQADDHTAHGIEVDEQIWLMLQRLAKNVLVEATEESRQRGAGEGAD